MRRIAAVVVCVVVACTGCGAKNPTSPSDIGLPLALETAHYGFHYSPGQTVDADWQETYHTWATARLAVLVPQKIGYFKYQSRQEMGDHTGRYGTNGFADPEHMNIHTLWSTDNHEVVHLFMSLIGESTALFSEGVAVAFQTDPARGDFESRFNGEEVHHAARRYLASGQLVLPLDRIIETAGFRAIADSVLAYREAGSFVRFLIDRYGLDRLLAFYRSGVKPNDSRVLVKPRFQQAIGVSLEDAEAAWLEMLRTGG